MSDADIIRLLRQAPFSFVGTIEHLGAATMSNVPIGERTAVVRVDYVLHAPPAFNGIAGQRITMQLAADKDMPVVGEAAAFFVEGLAFGESITVAEIGRLPVEAVMDHITRTAEAGQPGAFEALLSQVETQRVREHINSADAVIVGRVISLEKAVISPPSLSEHDPDWWKATLEVYHVEQGNVQTGMIAALYANSLDVRWRNAPKPRASQEGLWILHAVEGPLLAVAPFQILHPEDYQQMQQLDALRGNGG
jgi:hypothetical protein